MSNIIDSLKNEYIERNQDKITFSIRFSIKEDLILQEICDAYDLTRQELIYRVVKEQLLSAWEDERKKDASSIIEEPNLEHKEENARYFLLNTNKANDVADHDFMLNKQVAAAFEDGYKEKIQRLNQGDWVFLYESGRGVVAFGQVAGELEKAPHYHRENKTFFKKLSPFHVLKTPMKAREVKSILEREFPFAQTLSKIGDGEKLLKEIQVNFINTKI